MSVGPHKYKTYTNTVKFGCEFVTAHSKDPELIFSSTQPRVIVLSCLFLEFCAANEPFHGKPAQNRRLKATLLTDRC